MKLRNLFIGWMPTNEAGRHVIASWDDASGYWRWAIRRGPWRSWRFRFGPTYASGTRYRPVPGSGYFGAWLAIPLLGSFSFSMQPPMHKPRQQPAWPAPKRVAPMPPVAPPAADDAKACSDCGATLTAAEAHYYGATCEACEGRAFHASEAAEGGATPGGVSFSDLFATIFDALAGSVASEQVKDAARLAAAHAWKVAEPHSAPQPDLAATLQQLRREICDLPRYSFWLSDSGVARVPDKGGRWIEWDLAAQLCEPEAVEAMLAKRKAHL